MKPLLRRGGLSGAVYVISRYKERSDGNIEAIEKHDVTDQFEELTHDHGDDACPSDIYLEDLGDISQIVAEYLVGKIDARYAIEQVRQAVEDYAEPTTPELAEALGASPIGERPDGGHS